LSTILQRCLSTGPKRKSEELQKFVVAESIISCVLTPLSAIFQLYHGDQF
jgi:hypothetical protein